MPRSSTVKVEVNTSQLEGTNKSVFEALQNAVSEYVNTTKWTDAQFSANERIEATLFFNITKYDEGDGRMEGTLQVQAIRPVYNSSYTTTLINFRDTKVDFTYSENEPLVYNEMNMESQLTAIVNFYVYLILAVDFDSFAPRGGDPISSVSPPLSTRRSRRARAVGSSLRTTRTARPCSAPSPTPPRGPCATSITSITSRGSTRWLYRPTRGARP